MLLNNPKVNFKPKLSSVLDETIDALLTLPEYKGYSKEDIISYLDAISYKESGGRNITQMGGGPASGYYQIEDASLPYAIQGLQHIAKRSGRELPSLKGKRAMDLSKDEQAAISLAHDYMQGVAYDKTVNFKDWKNSWLDFHWVGKRDSGYEKKRQEYAQNWDKVMKNYPGYNPKASDYPQYKPESDNTRIVSFGRNMLVNPDIITDPNYGKYAAVVKP